MSVLCLSLLLNVMLNVHWCTTYKCTSLSYVTMLHVYHIPCIIQNKTVYNTKQEEGKKEKKVCVDGWLFCRTRATVKNIGVTPHIFISMYGTSLKLPILSHIAARVPCYCNNQTQEERENQSMWYFITKSRVDNTIQILKWAKYKQTRWNKAKKNPKSNPKEQAKGQHCTDR